MTYPADTAAIRFSSSFGARRRSPLMLSTIRTSMRPPVDGVMENTVHRDELQALSGFVRFFEREPRGFDDAGMDRAYKDLLRDSRGLLDAMNRNVFSDSSDWYSVPSDWADSKPRHYREVIQEIGDSHEFLVGSYDSFILEARRKRFKSVIVPPDGVRVATD